MELNEKCDIIKAAGEWYNAYQGRSIGRMKDANFGLRSGYCEISKRRGGIVKIYPVPIPQDGSCRAKNALELWNDLPLDGGPVTLLSAAKQLNRGTAYVHSLILQFPKAFSFVCAGKKIRDASIGRSCGRPLYWRNP